MRTLHLPLLLLAAALSPPVHGNACHGPDLHSLRLVDATTLEVQGLGGTAQTRDGGKTWRVVGQASSDGDTFGQRAFRGPGGHEFQNLSATGGDVVIERSPESRTWRQAWTGLLLQVSGGDAFVYQGELRGNAINNRGWEMRNGVVEQYTAGSGGADDGAYSARMKVEFKPGSVCVHTEATWSSTPCSFALQWPSDTPFALTGFAVAPPPPGGEYPNPRDVYLSSTARILHWQAAANRWVDLRYPPDWFKCNGPVPR